MNKFYRIFIKRFLDFFLSLIFILLLSPLFILLIIIKIIFDGFPVFYCPLRGGYKGTPFKIIKFRTMVRDADKIGEGTTSLNDPRITKIGNILRKTKLDEIPQLFNILIGNMSFIGPRPELLKYTDNYSEEQKEILNVRPGITDFSSVRFVSLDEQVGDTNAEENYEKFVLPEKNKLRIKYSKECSFVTDTKIFFETIYVVLKKIFNLMFRRNNGKN